VTSSPEPASGLHHYEGPATVTRFAVYVQSALSVSEPLHYQADGVSWLFTADAEEALRWGAPPAAERKYLTFTGANAEWSFNKAVERLRREMRLGSALCIRIVREVGSLTLDYAWRGEAGIAFMGEDGGLMDGLGQTETQSLVAVPLALPPGATPLFTLIDQETQIRLPGDPRPLRVQSVTGRLHVAQSFRVESFESDRFTRLAAREPLPDLGLLRVALDRTVPAMDGFVAAWAALERLVKGKAAAVAPELLSADLAQLSPAMRDVRMRLDQPRALDSVTNAYLLVRWSLGGDDAEAAKAKFQRLNGVRQRIYHGGDASGADTARDEVTALLLELLRLRQKPSATVG